MPLIQIMILHIPTIGRDSFHVALSANCHSHRSSGLISDFQSFLYHNFAKLISAINLRVGHHSLSLNPPFDLS